MFDSLFFLMFVLYSVIFLGKNCRICLYFVLWLCVYGNSYFTYKGLHVLMKTAIFNKIIENIVSLTKLCKKLTFVSD